MRNGCERFREWGWTSGNPELEYEIVDCPPAFVKIIEGAFDENGVVPEENPSNNPTASPTAASSGVQVGVAIASVVVAVAQVAQLFTSHLS